MNTNSNLYTVIYSTVLVVVVAAVLAFVAISLQDKQNENIKIETISKVLNAATQSFESVELNENSDVISMYTNYIENAYYVDGYGKKSGEMNTGKANAKEIVVATTSDLKKQNDIIKTIEAGKEDALKSLRLPVYVFNIEGSKVTVVPCYGAGLWGPIWGYVAVADNGKTIDGAIFDHKGETPGLGAKIAEKPFYSCFKGKEIGNGDKFFEVRKANGTEDLHSVDAISGATITSQALGKSLNVWFKYYQPFFASIAAEKAAAEAAAQAACAETETVKEVEE